MENNNNIVKQDTSSIPEININLQNPNATALVADERILSYFEEAIGNIKNDRQEAYDQYMVFNDMLTNDGDPSSATKEALVNCLKLRHDATDKMIKVLDLWMRAHLRQRDTMKGYIAVQQNNKIQTTSPTNVRNLIRMAEEMENPHE